MGKFRGGTASQFRETLAAFQRKYHDWLEDYALLMALKDARGGEAWYDWPTEYRQRSAGVLSLDRQELADEVGAYQFGQFLFSRQWQELRAHAKAKGIRLIGDVPIFVSPDSADVWANPRGYLLDKSLRPKVVAGVPPDYFSRTGQLWGNPHYDWEAMKRDGYSWWAARLKTLFELVDVVRLDHFRDCWRPGKCLRGVDSHKGHGSQDRGPIYSPPSVPSLATCR